MNNAHANTAQPSRAWTQRIDKPALADALCCAGLVVAGFVGYAFVAWLVWTTRI